MLRSAGAWRCRQYFTRLRAENAAGRARSGMIWLADLRASELVESRSGNRPRRGKRFLHRSADVQGHQLRRYFRGFSNGQNGGKTTPGSAVRWAAGLGIARENDLRRSPVHLPPVVPRSQHPDLTIQPVRRCEDQRRQKNGNDGRHEPNSSTLILAGLSRLEKTSFSLGANAALGTMIKINIREEDRNDVGSIYL